MLLHPHRGRLAINAVLEIALKDTEALLSRRALAERLRVSWRHLEEVLFALAENGMIKGRRGHDGGYALARDPRLISVYDILCIAKSIDGAGPSVAGSFSELIEKVVVPALAEAEQTFANALRRMSLDDLIRSCARKTIQDRRPSSLAAATRLQRQQPGDGRKHQADAKVD